MNALAGDRSQWTAQFLLSRTRVLGDDFAPPRPFYLTYIPFILAFTGIVAWLTASPASLIVASLVGGALGCYMMYDWLFRGPTRFSTIIAFSFLIGYGLGAFNTWATTPRAGLTLGEYLGLDDAVLARGMAAILISGAVTIFLGEIFERPLFGREFRFLPDERIYGFIYLGTLAIAAAFASGAITFNGVAATESGSVSVYKTFLMWLFSPLVALAVVTYLMTPRHVLRKRLTGGAALVLFGLLVLMGRRVLVYTVFETIFLARMAGFKLKGSIPKKILIFFAVIAFILAGTLGFMLLRIAGYGPTAKTDRSLGERIGIAYEWAREGTALDKALTSTRSNVQTRTFILGYFASVLEGSSTHTPALGENTIGLLQVAIPSVIDPDKDRFFSEEALANRIFGFGYVDEANSFLTNGAVDFGLIGVMVFPLAIAFLLRFSLEYISRIMDSLSTWVLLLAAVSAAMATENSITAIADVVLHGCLFSAGVAFYFSLPRFRFRS